MFNTWWWCLKCRWSLTYSPGRTNPGEADSVAAKILLFQWQKLNYKELQGLLWITCKKGSKKSNKIIIFVPMIMSILSCIKSQVTLDSTKTKARSTLVSSRIFSLVSLIQKCFVLSITFNFIHLNHSSQVGWGTISPFSSTLLWKQWQTFPGKIHCRKIFRTIEGSPGLSTRLNTTIKIVWTDIL